jgi:radical SAM superfamily enzyme YgiQ (UPF0313 family)
MKIILTTSPRAEGDLERGGLPFLGIGYIASWLEKHGYEAVITDPHTFNWDTEKSVQEILKHNPDAVGVAATTNNRFKGIALIRELKKRNPDLFIFAGGPHFTMTAENALRVIPEIDAVVKGEGEITTQELLDAFKKDKDFSRVQGIFYRDKKGETIETPNRPFLQDINAFILNWSLFDLDKYHRPIDGTNIRAVGVMSSRGCPNFCAFCVSAAFWKGILRLRNPIKFVDEVEFLKNNYGFEGFDFWDDTLTVSKDHVRKICNEILKRNLNIRWYAPTRANTIDKEILTLMAKAGCIRISFGAESGSPRILKIIRKGIKPEQVINAAQISSDLGMQVMVNFMVNLPYETLKDLRMTIDLMKKLNKIKNVTAAYGFSIIYPGTEMEIMSKKEGWLPKNFSWNEPYKSEKYKIAGVDSSLPLMEWPGAEIEKIKAIMIRELGIKGNIIKKGFDKIKKIKSTNELKELARTVWNYIKKRD